MPGYGGSIGPPARFKMPHEATVPARPTPLGPPHPPQVFRPTFSSQPFAPAQHQAQQRVVQAQRALPKAPTPYIPRLSNPTPHQTHVALQLVHHSMRQALGPNPGAGRLRQYQQELASDPRQRQFLETVKHYTQAAEAHLQAERARNPTFTLAQMLPTIEKQNPFAYERLREGQAARQGEERKGVADLRAEALKHPQEAGLGGAIGSAIQSLASAAANVHIAPGGWAGNLVNEAVDMPAQTFLSAAVAGSAARQAVEGKPGQLESLGKSVLSQVEHPVKSFKQAPLSTALLFAGGENALGRIGGRLARSGALGDRAAELASTARPDLNLYANERMVGRQYNADPIRKAAQLAYERKVLPNLPGDLRQPDPFQATGWRLKRNLVGGITKVGRVDRIASANEDTRRVIVKGGAINKIEAVKPQVKGAEHVLPMLAAQRVVRSAETAVPDLERVLHMWRSATPTLKGPQLKANLANVANGEKALQLAKDNPAALNQALAAAEAHIGVSKPLDAELVHGGKLTPEQLRASLFPYAQTHMGAVHDGTAMRAADGTALSNEDILGHMAEHGVRPPAYVSHKVGVAGRGSFYQSVLRNPGLERYQRTGSSFAKGIADHSWEALKGSLARQASQAAQLAVRRRTVNRLSFGGPYESTKAAGAAADQFHATAEGDAVRNALGEVVPVHLGSGQIVEAGHVAPATDAHTVLDQFGLKPYTPEAAAENGKFALVPRQVMNRLQQHDSALSSNSDVGRGLQVYQQAFRRAKLNTSMPHIAGVMQEQGIRLGAEGAGLKARAAGAKFNRNLGELAELDPHGIIADTHGPLGEHFREIASTLANRGGVAGSQRANDVVRKGDQFAQTSALGYVFRGGEGALRSRAGDAVLKPWDAWKTAVEGGLARVEHGTRNALVAKALKDTGLIKSWHELNGMTDQAVKMMIKGKLTPNMADHLAEAVDNMGGNWNRQTPTVRTAVGKFVPFGLWWLNSMRWLYRLPVTHPVKTAIAGALYNATREYRNAKGQGFDAAHPVPTFLQNTIDATLPLVGPGKVAPTYYSPGGTLGPEAGTTAADLLVPQLAGPIAALRNQNALSGAKLETASKKPLSTSQQALNVLSSVVTGPLPFATQAEKALTGGGKPYGTANLLTDVAAKLGGGSQVKPGTARPWQQVLGKMLMPTRFDFPKAGSTPVSGGSGSGVKLSPGELKELHEAVKQATPELSPGERQELKEALARR